jgi:diacylglycerol kinase family enzyme
VPTITLIVNPAARRAPQLRAQLPAITAWLEAHGYTVGCLETSAGPHSARAVEAALTEAAFETSSLILACGGDGTVHAVLQALIARAPIAARDRLPTATLGVVPLGTANALARNLNLPLDPLAAIRKLLTYTPRILPVGEIESSTERRYFLAMAGCGPDGALAHGLAAPTRSKARFGRAAYYAHAARLFLTRRWPSFQVDYRLPQQTNWQTITAVALMASRLPDLGGLFTRLTPLAALSHPHLHVHLLRPPAQFAFPAWFACARTGLPNPWLDTLDVAELRCTPLSAAPVYMQADAEPLGPLPLTLRILPDAVRLLMPPETSPAVADRPA